MGQGESRSGLIVCLLEIGGRRQCPLKHARELQRQTRFAQILPNIDGPLGDRQRLTVSTVHGQHTQTQLNTLSFDALFPQAEEHEICISTGLKVWCTMNLFKHDNEWQGEVGNKEGQYLDGFVERRRALGGGKVVFVFACN